MGGHLQPIQQWNVRELSGVWVSQPYDDTVPIWYQCISIVKTCIHVTYRLVLSKCRRALTQFQAQIELLKLADIFKPLTAVNLKPPIGESPTLLWIWIGNCRFKDQAKWFTYDITNSYELRLYHELLFLYLEERITPHKCTSNLQSCLPFP